jgi:hypothetical protein
MVGCATSVGVWGCVYLLQLQGDQLLRQRLQMRVQIRLQLHLLFNRSHLLLGLVRLHLGLDLLHLTLHGLDVPQILLHHGRVRVCLLLFQTLSGLLDLVECDLQLNLAHELHGLDADRQLLLGGHLDLAHQLHGLGADHQLLHLVPDDALLQELQLRDQIFLVER